MSSIRSTYPMYFNTTAIPFPMDYFEDHEVVDKVKQTEAGTDIVTVVRYRKLKASMTFVCLQSTLQTLAGFNNADSFTFKRYDPVADAYGEKTVRMRNFHYAPRKGSEDLTEVKGVWEVSFDLEEF